MAPTAITHPESTAVPTKVAQEPQNYSVIVQQLTDVARDVMNQAIDLLKNTLTDDKQLTYQSEYIPGSTIAPPTRTRSLCPTFQGKLVSGDVAAALNSFVGQAVADVTVAESSNGQAPAAALSYDARIRDTPMETSINAGIQAFEEAIKQLDDIAKYAPEDLPIVLTADTGPYQQVLNTTYGRELWFGSLHAIHHWSWFA
ncbi:hypothetical protein RhiXN_01910 [Rhizoctonia solani]|uniref:Uncharacterized protein n=1 Tax=Rhizoctonia solani TaxID=456999 RepID=A0A8H8P9Z3_9AGAM|nr:uncharacterized protein RhiXN_01910 [Rhizoctonia solani]QRW27315.1 hypothetical protein RhiXN_01910 [Rhizoctonia solani]